MTTAKQVMISFKDVTLGYGKEAVMKCLNFEIYSGDFLGIIGPNGAGKTTLLKAILGLIKPIFGTISYHLPNISFGYVIQRQFVDDVFPLTAKEIVAMGRYGAVGPGRRLSKEDWEHVEDALEQVGMSDFSSQSYRSLSGGQKQRVLIGRALASMANILILDEPTNDMDIKGETQIMELINKIHIERHTTIVIVSHILHNIINYVSKLAFINRSGFEIRSVEDVVKEEHLSWIFDKPVKVGDIFGKKVVIAD